MQEQKRKELVKCQKCNCSWMEKVFIAQYDNNEILILFQEPKAIQKKPFVILRCAKCGKLQDSYNLAGVTYDNNHQEYYSMLQELEKNV